MLLLASEQLWQNAIGEFPSGFSIRKTFSQTGSFDYLLAHEGGLLVRIAHSIARSVVNRMRASAWATMCSIV